MTTDNPALCGLVVTRNVVHLKWPKCCWFGCSHYGRAGRSLDLSHEKVEPPNTRLQLYIKENFKCAEISTT